MIASASRTRLCFANSSFNPLQWMLKIVSVLKFMKLTAACLALCIAF